MTVIWLLLSYLHFTQRYVTNHHYQIFNAYLFYDIVKVALENLKSAGVDGKVTIKIGPAAQSLAQLHPAESELFDLVFIDADKPSNVVYFTEAKRLVRKGGVIVRPSSPYLATIFH